MKMFRCPMCQGSGTTKNPTGMLFQTCPMCDAQGEVPAKEGRRPAWYPLQLIVPASGTITGSIQILGSEDFEWQYVLATYTDARLAITLFDNSSGMPLMIAPNQNSNVGLVPITLFAGTAQLPFPIRPVYRIPRKNTVTVIGTDSSAATNTLNFSMFGNSITDQGAPQVKAS